MKRNILLMFLCFGFAWSIFAYWQTFQPAVVQATTFTPNNSIMERVRTQPMPFGTIYIYACVDTRIGYVAVVNNQGVLHSWERMTNVMGEPQRFNSAGQVLPRLETENWFTSGEIRGRLVEVSEGVFELQPSNSPGWRLHNWEHSSPNVYPSVFRNQ